MHVLFRIEDLESSLRDIFYVGHIFNAMHVIFIHKTTLFNYYVASVTEFRNRFWYSHILRANLFSHPIDN